MLTTIQYIELISIAAMVFYTATLITYMTYKRNEINFVDIFWTSAGFYILVILASGAIIYSLT